MSPGGAPPRQAEAGPGERFQFGRNWKAFLSTHDEGRIREAESSLTTMLHCVDLRGKSFLDAIRLPVAPGGQLFIALYNDQGAASSFWKKVKAAYCSGLPGKWLVSALFVPLLALRSLAAGTVKHGNPFAQMRNYRRERDMSLYHDWVDWLGGWPFEVARPEREREFFAKAGFELTEEILTSSWGCNQYVFHRA